MADGPIKSNDVSNAQLLEEMEQLRTALESSLEENARLACDRDRLDREVAWFSSELKAANSRPIYPAGPSTEQRERQAEEELRAAFAELQVLTEELEVANTSLQETNQQLDARVEARTGEIRAVNAALRVVEVSLRTIADLVPDLLWRANASGEADWFNQRWFAYTGYDPAEAFGKRWLEAIHPTERAAAGEAWSEATERGRLFQQEHRIRDHLGNYRWFLLRAAPMREEDGTIAGWYGSGTDIHDRREAMEALERSERRFRTLIEGMPQLVWRAVDGGQWTWCSRQWTSFTGQTEVDSRGRGWLAMLHPDDWRAALAAWERAQADGLLAFEARIFRRAQGRYRHFQTRALPVRNEAGQVTEWLGTSTDIDVLHRLQAQQGVLVAELQHRTRNILAVVQAVTSRTLKGSSSFEEFSESIGHRLAALARVQGLLSRRDSSTRVPFDTLIREELSAHIDLDENGDGEHVTLRGPPGAPLRSSLVQTLALALHELATNAVKYGALSQQGGHLRIEWELRGEDEAHKRLFIDWRETGVPERAEKETCLHGGGYGRELIEKALPYQLGAPTSYELTPDGVHCTIDIAVPSDSQLEKIL